MARCPVVKPEVVRLFLADVHRRALADLEARTDEKTQQKNATPAELEAARAAVTRAEQDADFIDVKKRLNAGEYRELLGSQIKESGDKLIVDFRKVGISKVQAYLLGWSFVGLDGQPLPISAIDSIDPEGFADVIAAIDAHHDAVEEEMAARKNARAGEMRSEAISSSAS